MLKNTLSAVRGLFPGAKSRGRAPLIFSWRLVHRRNRPFLLLPERAANGSDGFELYSAQRPLARLWRVLLPSVLHTPLAGFFRQIVVNTDPESEFVQFLARESGVTATELRTPVIKFGGVAGKTQRLVLLLHDAGGHPIRVVKVGLNRQGRAATEREAALLSALPADVVGCTGITGRFSSVELTGFATAYFQGVSLDNDIGIERLFHNWLNDTPPELIQNLASWRELESAMKDAQVPQWPLLRAALAGQAVRTTIFHGDFAPWNVRMTNLENIRAFDWERGDLKGIPAWDWFHFIVQTSILVKRYSPQRVAAELEQLVHSPRFQKYARDAGIGEIIEPLLLAYLLHQEIVVQPLEGCGATNRLFQLLWAKWQARQNPGHTVSIPVVERRMPARKQLRFALVRLANLFWEPSLSPPIRPPLGGLVRRHWLALLASAAWLSGVALLHGHTNPHLLFTPFYLIPCVLLALTTDRRLGSIVACLAAISGPLVQHLWEPGEIPLHVMCWNMVMRVVAFQLIVILLDSVRRQSRHRQARHPLPEPDALHTLADNWAVILITSIYFALVVGLDVWTDPNLVLLPLYMVPCIVFTLTLSWRWGTLAALIAAAAGPMTQRFDDPGYQLWGVEFWNTAMRLVIFQTIVLLLNRLRRESILYAPVDTNAEFK